MQGSAEGYQPAPVAPASRRLQRRPFARHGAVVVGHRGARRAAPENTMAAFAAAAELGATWVEFDVRLADDGTPVVVHDATFEDGRAVCELSPEDLAQRGVATLATVLDSLPAGLGADVEVKHRRGEPGWDADTTIARRTAPLVAEQLGHRHVVVTSFDPQVVAVTRSSAPQVPVGLLTGVLTPVASGLARARELTADLLAPHYTAVGLSPAGVASVHAHDLAVMVWTVNGARRLRRAAQLGADAICTDDVATAVAVLSGAGAGADGADAGRGTSSRGASPPPVGAQRSSSSQSANAARSSSGRASSGWSSSGLCGPPSPGTSGS